MKSDLLLPTCLGVNSFSFYIIPFYSTLVNGYAYVVIKILTPKTCIALRH